MPSDRFWEEVLDELHGVNTKPAPQRQEDEPLSCDCYPGCWAEHSKDWLTVPYTKQNWHFCVEFIPYGMYVGVGDKIRIHPKHTNISFFK